MAAGQGYIEFSTGDVLTAAAANGYLASQVVMVFASAAARTSAIASPQEGMISYLKDTNSTEYYSGSAWVAIGGAASPLTTKGDLYTYSTTNARLGVGTNGQVLTADSAEATGLKWATAGAGLTLIDEIAVTSSSSTNVNDVFSSTYKNYKIMLVGASTGASPAEVTMRLRVSGTDTTANYAAQEIYSFSTTLAGRSNLFGTDEWYMGDLGTSTTGGVISFDLTSPNLANRTSFVCNAANGGSTLKITGGAQTDTTQFTGFTLNYAQTTTGSIFVYGYAKE